MLTDALRIGVFTIQYQYILAIASFLLTYYILQWLLVKQHFIDFFRKHYWDSVLFFIIAFKISPLFTSPSLALNNPLSILYFTGSNIGIYIGVSLSLLYLYIQNFRTKTLSNLHIFVLFTDSVFVYFIVFLGLKAVFFTWII